MADSTDDATVLAACPFCGRDDAVVWVIEAARRVNQRRIAYGRDADAESELHDALAAYDAARAAEEKP